MKRKGIQWIIIGLVIFIIGVVAIPYGIMMPLLKGDPHELTFKAPASGLNYEAKSLGRHYLWNNHETNFEGEAYFIDPNPPAPLQVRVTTDSGELVPFQVDTTYTLSRIGNSRGSLGYVELEQPTQLTWSATGFEGERIFSISENQINQFFYQLILIGLAMLATILVGGVLALWGVFNVVCSGIPRAKTWLESDLPLRKKILNILNNR